MATSKSKPSNKLKRKRGKKFRYYEGGQQSTKSTEVANPFEDHAASRKAAKDRLKRSDLIEEYKNRGKNNVFIDNRIGKTTSKLSEEDKMRLRYMREQKEQMRVTKVTKKRAKFNLDDDLEDGDD